MFKKLLVAGAVLAISQQIAFAQTGPYVGVGLGMEKGSFSRSVASVFGGYGYNFTPRYYLGGELLGTFTPKLSNFSKRTRTYGFSILPGVMLSDTILAYARAGIVKAHITNESFLLNNATEVTTSGGQLGLGLETSLATNWSLRGEYTYTRYKTVNNANAPHANDFTLGLLYRFS